MKSAIEKIFYGTFANIENLKPTAEQMKSLDAVIECDDQLTALFKDNAEILALYERFKRVMDDHAGAEAFALYREGFRNGFQIALDAMDED